MRGLVVVLSLGVHFCAAQDSYGSYPTAYPFEDEEVDGFTGADLVEMPDTGMPDFTFDADDSGGYYLYGAYRQSMDNQEGPAFYSIGKTDAEDGWLNYFWFAEHLGVGLWSGFRLSTSPLSSWNCTLAGSFYSANNFPCVQNGDTIGTDCCSEYWGHAQFGDDTAARQTQFADFISTNGCETMTEEVYCATGDAWHWLCLENYVTREDRIFVKPCLDNFAVHMAQCSLLKVTGAHEQLKSIFAEPDAYIDDMSIVQTFSMYSLEYTTFDKVCHPYTYYNQGGGGGSSASTLGAGLVSLLLAVAAF